MGRLDLRGPDGRVPAGLLAQPKRLALLIYLALAPSGTQRRDTLLALFWPEADSLLGRGALRQALHFLRQTLGADCFIGHGEESVGLAPGALWCDAAAFREAIAAGRLTQALELYRGDFLPGFHVADSSPELERWLEETRSELRERAAEAARALITESERAGLPLAAAQWARRALELAPEDESVLRRLMTLLSQAGDRTGALHAYESFARRLGEDLGVEPAPETQELDAALRAPSSPRARGRRAADITTAAFAESSPRTPRRHQIWMAIAGGALAVLVSAGLLIRALRHESRPPVVAVGLVADPAGGGDTSVLARTLPELLATDLARVPSLRVVSHARLYEMLGALGVAQPSQSTMGRAAQRAGATEMVEGLLAHRGGDTLRLDVRRVDLATGVVRQGYSVEGTDLFTLADRATALIARDAGLTAPAPPLATVTSTSLVARRLYEEGLKSFYARFDPQGAYRLFAAALAEDSTFAMAAYEAGESALIFDPAIGMANLRRAAELAGRTSERERLLIRRAWTEHANDPAQRAVAETLAARYPGEPEAEYGLGEALLTTGDFLGAVARFHRVITLDSLSLRDIRARCRACDAYGRIVYAYAVADSLPAAEREARSWTRARPASSAPWLVLFTVLSRAARWDSALAALRHAAAEEPGGRSDVGTSLAQLAVQADDFPQADRLLYDRVTLGGAAAVEALWWLTISLRCEGRLTEAESAAQQYHRLDPGNEAASIPAAELLAEMGRGREAAARFEAISAAPGPLDGLAPGPAARRHAWMLSHAAAALAGVGDTARLATLADTIAYWGSRSGYGRDRLLAFYVRGLLLEAQGRDREAETALRQSIFSTTEGNGQANLELGRLLLVQNRPREAIAILAPVLRGPAESGNYYVTRTEVHALLAQAFEAAGARDSAASHYRLVATAWSGGEPAFQVRAADARLRAARLGPRH